MAATTDYAPLRPSDPAWIDSFALVGRVGEDARADVYVARDPAGVLVEVAWATTETELDADAGTLSRISAPSLAQVTAVGRWAGRPYLVSEHVEGEPLRAVIDRDGPWSGPRLHRLAVAMVTALVALHQAGVAHGDLHPGTVTRGRDGIRVTGYGLTGLASTQNRPAQADDMLAWATVVLFAATGLDDPDLDVLDEHLRDVVEPCLAADPALRPDAGEVLLRLVGHSPLTIAPQPVPTSSTARRGLTLSVGALLLVVAGVGAGHVLARATQPTPPAAATALPNLTALPSLATTPGQPTEVKPGPIGGTVLHENPADPMRFVVMRNGKGGWVRTASGFAAAGKVDEVAASLDGTWAAVRQGDTVTLLNRKDGATHPVNVPGGTAPTFDHVGKTLLLTQPTGFALVDTATKTVRSVATAEKEVGPFTWAPGGANVMASYQTQQGYGVRVHDLSGKTTRSMPWVGQLASRNPVSPSGRLFMTMCPSGGTWCAWDAGTGARRSTLVNTVEGAEWWGWWDDDHSLVYQQGKGLNQVRVLDFQGRSDRVALTLTKAADTADLMIARAAR